LEHAEALIEEALMHTRDFDITPGRRPGLADKFIKALHAAADDHATLAVEPGEYHLDAPILVELDQNVGRSWGVSAVGAVLIAAYTEPDPVLMFDVVADVSVRFLSLDGLSIRGLGQHGLVLRCLGNRRWLYSFVLSRLTAEGCDDAIRLEGDVFEGEICWCYGRDSNHGLALGNDDQGGILSAINVWGGSYSQCKIDGIRMFGPAYREPYDVSIYGTYAGNNGRYAVNAAAGFTLFKGLRLENPWCDTAQFDPDGTAERAAINMCNFGIAEQTSTGGNGNGTTLINGYLAGGLTLRECSVGNADPARTLRLATLDGQSGASFCTALSCNGGPIKATDNVRVSYV
jgi:hypothetical protein